jgi:Protein of unknown function (DUF2946)
MMYWAICRRGLRGAVGLIAAYALVLQAFFAYSIATQAAAQGNSSGSFFVICVNSDDAVTMDGMDAPVKPGTHCPICTLSGSAAATLPETAVLPAWQAVSAGRTPFVSVQACVSYHEARAGLTRAPPQNV